jgi:nifR3 family TIM-barrel protein
MADVTDAAFRRIIAKYGKPDVMWTEFVSVEGLCSPGREVLLRDFMFTDGERPIVAQIFGSTPDKFFKVAGLIRELGFDGIDINMGCPDRNVEKQGGGASMMKNPSLAQEVIAAAKEGGKGLPVSVKTRVGYNKVELDTWLPKLLEMDLAAITIHARTRKEMSLVPANWEHVARAVEMAKGTGTLIIGNGDVKDLADAKAKAEATGADGIMLGRAIFGNPRLFAPDEKLSRLSLDNEVLIAEKLRVMIEHTKLFVELLGDIKNFAIMKKHYKAYVNGFDGAKELRIELMAAEGVEEVEKLVDRFLGEK